MVMRAGPVLSPATVPYANSHALVPRTDRLAAVCHLRSTTGKAGEGEEQGGGDPPAGRRGATQHRRQDGAAKRGARSITRQTRRRGRTGGGRNLRQGGRMG